MFFENYGIPKRVRSTRFALDVALAIVGRRSERPFQGVLSAALLEEEPKTEAGPTIVVGIGAVVGIRAILRKAGSSRDTAYTRNGDDANSDLSGRR
jgi:hypothetical protein